MKYIFIIITSLFIQPAYGFLTNEKQDELTELLEMWKENICENICKNITNQNPHLEINECTSSCKENY